MRIGRILSYNSTKLQYNKNRNNPCYKTNSFLGSVDTFQKQEHNPQRGVIYANMTNVISIDVFACSSSEEPYTLAILLKELYPDSKFKIHAYDIDENIIHESNIEITLPDFSCYCLQLRLDLSDYDINSFTEQISEGRFR